MPSMTTGATQQSVDQLLQWIRVRQPGIYNAVQQQGLPMGAIDFNQILDNISKTAQLYLTVDAQRDLMNMNIERAKNGLMPIDVSQYSPGVNVGLTNSTNNTLKMALILGGGLLALYLVTRS